MSRLQASLLGGAFIGVLSSLPIINLLNFCCCLWVVAGGALTTWLLASDRPTVPEGADVAVTGLLAGVIGGVVSTALSLVVFFVFGDMSEQLRTIVEQMPQLPPEARDRMLAFEPGAGFVLVNALITIPIYAIFSMGGALLALLFFRRPPAPAAQP